MKAKITFKEREIEIDLQKGIDISLPITTDPNAARAWYINQPEMEPVVLGDWIGDVEEYRLLDSNLEPLTNWLEWEAIIDLPEVGLSDDELADQVLHLQETIGDFAKTFRLARQKGVITQLDFNVIQKNTLSIISTALQLNAEIEQMVRPDPNGPVAAKSASLKVA